MNIFCPSFQVKYSIFMNRNQFFVIILIQMFAWQLLTILFFAPTTIWFNITKLRNISGNILDLVFSNFPKIEVLLSLDSLFECDSHHHTLEIVLPINKNIELASNEIIYDFKNKNYENWENNQRIWNFLNWLL